MKYFEQFLDELHLEDLHNPSHPSIFDENEEYNMLIVRMPILGEKLEAQSLGFVIAGQNSFLYNRDKKKFDELDDLFLGPHKIIDTMTDALLKSFTKYQDSIVDKEELLYENGTPDSFMTDWIILKRDILHIQRILERTSEAVLEMINHYEESPDFPVNKYTDLHEHIERIVRSTVHQLSKLDYLYSFYSARTNDKINKMIYVLTIISAIFLPLNLLVGFFGINVNGLPFINSGESGAMNVFLVMLASVALTFAAILLWHKKVQEQ